MRRNVCGLWMTLALLPALMLGSAQAVAEWRIESGPQRTAMIELFTSQGCSSCPPAERYLNRFTDNPRLWSRFIPLAFHVDYWDYLGWKDRFALPGNAERQRRYARMGYVRGVYTPGFMRNGRGWRPGLGEPHVAEQAGGRLAVSLNEGRLAIHYRPDGQAETQAIPILELHMAILGMGLKTDIRAGENAGRHALHDFVVLHHTRLPGPGLEWQAPMPTLTDTDASRLALVAWVSRPGDPTPLQAVGGYLPGAGE